MPAARLPTLLADAQDCGARLMSELSHWHRTVPKSFDVYRFLGCTGKIFMCWDAVQHQIKNVEIDEVDPDTLRRRIHICWSTAPDSVAVRDIDGSRRWHRLFEDASFQQHLFILSFLRHSRKIK